MNDQFMRTRPVLPLLLSMALPMVLSMLVNSLYNIVDSYFVARISEKAMTALSLVYPIQNLVTSLGVGFGVGVNAAIAFHMGAGEQEQANIAASKSVLLAFVHGVLLTIAVRLGMPTFLRMFTGDAEVLSLGIRYSNIAFVFSIAVMESILLEKIYQAVGRMQTTMVALMCGCILNILLDPLLIFGWGPIPALGIEGAAIATVLGQLLTLAVYLVVLVWKPMPVRFSLRAMAGRGSRHIVRRLYAVGIPATLNMALPSLLVSCLNAFLSGYSQSYVVVLGIYYKLQSFLYLPASGLVQGMRPVIGYNLGAGEHARVKRIYEVTLMLCGGIMLLGTVICQCLPTPLIRLFAENPETIAIGTTALRIISLGFIVSAVSVTACGALEGLGKGSASLIISLCRYTVVIIPLAFVLCRLLGPVGAWHAFWSTEVLAAVISSRVYKRAMEGKA